MTYTGRTAGQPPFYRGRRRRALSPRVGLAVLALVWVSAVGFGIVSVTW